MYVCMCVCVCCAMRGHGLPGAMMGTTTTLLTHRSQELAPYSSHENCSERHLVEAHISVTRCCGWMTFCHSLEPDGTGNLPVLACCREQGWWGIPLATRTVLIQFECHGWLKA